jgi:hypothetical protein
MAHPPSPGDNPVHSPRPQPRQATPAQTQAATTWLLTPQTVHIGPLRVCYRPSPIATYALLSTWWQSILKKLCPDNIWKWIRNWLHVYPSLHLEVGQTPQAQESQWWWTEWLTHLTHKRILNLTWTNAQNPTPRRRSLPCNGRHHPTPAQGASGGATTRNIRVPCADLLPRASVHHDPSP